MIDRQTPEEQPSYHTYTVGFISISKEMIDKIRKQNYTTPLARKRDIIHRRKPVQGKFLL